MPKLHPFHGGLRLDGHKAESVERGLQQAGLPERLFLPLRQHIGDPNKPVVKVGDRVLQGQVIGAGSSLICAAVHAPTSGRISAIESHPVAHPSGQPDTCIVINVDGEDRAVEPAAIDTDRLAPEALIERICRAGIVGLGGAAFPTSPKLLRGKAQGIETLIINGVECEPYITCDDTLMRYHAAEIVRGSGYLQQILSPRTTYIGIEDNKPEAIAAMQQALAQHPLPDTEIVSIPTIYPSGGEKQLVQILTGKEVPHGQLAFDIGPHYPLSHRIGLSFFPGPRVLTDVVLRPAVFSSTVVFRGTRNVGARDLTYIEPCARLEFHFWRPGNTGPGGFCSGIPWSSSHIRYSQTGETPGYARRPWRVHASRVVEAIIAPGKPRYTCRNECIRRGNPSPSEWFPRA